jgi:hypothetical protein
MQDVNKRHIYSVRDVEDAADQHIGRSLLAGCGRGFQTGRKAVGSQKFSQGVAQVVVARIHAQAGAHQRVVAEGVHR